MSVKMLVEGLAGVVTVASGSPDKRISHLCHLSEQDGPEALGFCTLKGDAGEAAIRNTGASVVICERSVAAAVAKISGAKTLLVADYPRTAFALAAQLMLASERRKGQRDVSAKISESADIAKDAAIHALAIVGDGCVIGPGSCIGPGAVLYPRTVIGQECNIEAGAVLGSVGFGFVRDASGRLQRFPQLGRVIIGDNVEIGSRASIDCGSLQDTIIRCGTKIDDLAYVAHNVSIGRDCLIMVGAILCGGCRIGDGVEIAPGAVIRENVSIGARACIGLGAVVTKDVPEDELVAGVPARPFTRQ